MSTLLTELQRFAGAWATVDDGGLSIMICLANGADALGVYVHCAASNTSYKQEFDESDLYKVRSRIGENTSWANFFAAIAEAMHDNHVEVKPTKRMDGATAAMAAAATGGGGVAATSMTMMMTPGGAGAASLSHHLRLLAHDGAGDELSVMCHTSIGSNSNNSSSGGGGGVGKSIVFTVVHTADNLQAFILQQLHERQQMYTRMREYTHKLRQLAEEESALQTQSVGLEREALSLKETLARNKQQLQTANKRLGELKHKLLPEQTSNSSNPWTMVLSKQEMHMRGSRLVNPLGDRDCKEYDLVLLRLIKSYWISYDECDLHSPGNRVVQPFTANELTRQTQALTPGQARSVVWEAMRTLDDWAYDVFTLQRAMTGDDTASLAQQPAGGALFVTFYALLCRYRFLQKFNIDEQIVLNWLSMVEAGYHANPYHNSMHAADVVHITHFILTKGDLVTRCALTDEQVFAALFAAAVHDFDHPGVNNNFHIKTSSHLATLYNDQSVLENLHISSVFELMKNPSFNILAYFTEEQRCAIRELAVKMVLATDMGTHGKYLARMKARLQERAAFDQHDNQVLALQMALKMADVSNCGRPRDLCLAWSSKVSDEFYLQGDRERNHGLSCSPFMDRTQPATAKGQIAFISFVIVPFFEQMVELLPNMRFAVELAEGNKQYWLSVLDEA